MEKLEDGNIWIKEKELEEGKGLVWEKTEENLLMMTASKRTKEA